jgi:hypothetical protein
MYLQRSTNGYPFKMFNGVIIWMSNLHMVIALLTTKSQYMEATHTRKEVVWLHHLCSGIGFEKKVMKKKYNSQSEYSW